MGKRMRLPNGFGSVYKLSGSRRKPYAVSITTGFDRKGRQVRKIVGYVESRSEGLEMLSEYHRNPYDLDLKKLTFSKVFESLEVKLEKLVNSEKMSASNFKNLKSVYNNQCKSLYNKFMLDIKTKDMQLLIDESGTGYTTRGYMKNLFNKMFEHAIIDYELPLQVNPANRLSIGEKEKSDKHHPFSEEEEEILWENKDNEIVKLILIYNYCGARPNEIIKIKKEQVHLEEHYMIGGSKTRAGKNRVIPIHDKTLEFVKYFYYNSNNEYLITINDKSLSYGKYAEYFKDEMDNLNFNHTPYDTRHHFITKAKRFNLNEKILKRIVGHSIGDITESIYTHRSVEELVREINKIQ